jgi:hypothetical protein
MPKLLRSSETAGCGATIELDSGEVVYVSIAQAGVLVRLWDMKGGLFKSLMNNFFGPKLYDESSVYKNAQAARTLSLMFPSQSPNLRFRNPVLAAFSNAIWRCSSAAEVSIVLNGARTVPHSRSNRLATFNSNKYPITGALLFRAAAVNASNDEWLNSIGRKSADADTTLADEIQSAVIVDAYRIINDAQEAVGLKWDPFFPGDQLPRYTTCVVTFGFFVTLYIAGQVRKEGHSDPVDKTLFPRLIDALFLMGTTEEKKRILESVHQTFNELLRSEAPNVSEWRTNLSQLVFFYLIDDETLKQRGFSVLFGSMLKSLASAEE